jgi:pyrroloquinoline quinone (PQQ) biosynthesis protein C
LDERTVGEMQHPMSGRELLDQARADLTEVERSIRQHPFLDALEAGQASRGSLEALAGEQQRVIASDRRSFAQLAARFPGEPAGAFFLSMAEGEGLALGLLQDFAAAVGVDRDWLAAYEPSADCQAYPAFVAWLALNGSSTDVALAFLANLAAWGANCGRVADAFRQRYGLDDAAVAFFTFFASPPPGFEQRALAVIDAGLAAGDHPSHARRAARLLQAYELRFWDGLAAVG